MCERFGAGCLNPTTTISVENSLFGMNSFRPEPHVAQQSRRDKLRVPPAPATHHHILSNHLPVLNPDSEINPGLNQVRDVRNCNSLFEPAMLPSGILDLSGNEASFANPLPSSFNGSSNNLTSAKVGDPQNPSFWKGMGSQPSCDWIMNYMGSGGSAPIQTPMFASHLYLKPGFSGYQDVQSPLNNTPSELSTQCSQKQYGELHFTSPPFYQNALQEVVVTSSSTSVGNQGLEMASLVQQNVRETSSPCSWVDGGNELLLLPNPNFGNPTNAGVWMSRQSHQWSGEEDFVRNRSEGGYGVVDGTATTQGLSLSLSSKPLLELQVAQFEERFGHEELESRSCIVEGSQSFKMNDVGFLSPHSISNRGYGNSAQGIVGAAMDARRGVGPLGPFTGYATILKSSKFLKPAQQLLEEFCNVISGPKLLKQCETTERSFGSAGVSYDTVVGENEIGRLGNSVAASSSFNSSTERVLDKGACQVHGPEFQHKKAKLLYMQEEVCRRYKQYHQQMQMVVSSFESVAGLSSATPYTSLALKAVSKHFRCLKNAISNQLRHISKVLGEEFMSSPGSSGGEMMVTPRLKFIDQNLQKQKAGENSIGFLDHNQPVWRPQRGLPERAVGVLRAWLFEHFLHPYPTDTDKHMLANQTGLSRNQVSNWFINARVRLWKPMVEEIHMLETKGITEMDLNSAKNDGKPVSDSGLQPPVGKSLEDQTNNSVISDESMEQWHREKRSRMEECVVPTSMDGGLMGFAPYQRGIEIGGLGAVSLTLGLRHNDGAMGVQQQQQQIRRHFGSQMVHDFVG